MIDSRELIRKFALNAVRLSGIGTIASRFTAGSGAILMLHRVTDEPAGPLGINSHLAISPGFLDAVLTETAARGFRFVSMSEAVERLASGQTGERFIAITADDGYRDNLECALPVLEKHAAPITIYVAPNLIEGKVDLWWELLEEIVTQRDAIYLDTANGRLAIECATTDDKLRANAHIQHYLTTKVPEEAQVKVMRELAASAGIDPGKRSRDLLMNWDEIRKVAAHPLVTIGAHTMNHFNMARLADDAVAREMRDSARVLDIEVGSTPRHFAFPYGHEKAVGQREVAIAREVGFETAVTTRHGVIYPAHVNHLQALPRISVNGRYQQVAYVSTMVNGLTTALANRGRALVTV